MRESSFLKQKELSKKIIGLSQFKEYFISYLDHWIEIFCQGFNRSQVYLYGFQI